MSYTLPSLTQMLEAGLHYGHRTSHWHPKMAPFIFGERQDIHLINLELTQSQLSRALEMVKGVVSRGGTVLFVGTKRQVQQSVREAAESCGMPYVTERWLGGTLTNFTQIRQTIRRMKTLKEQKEKGQLQKYTKKEQLLLQREVEDMEEKIGGVQMMERVPEIVFVVDVRFEKTAVTEAKSVGSQVVALCDTNSNPRDIEYIIPGNDDATKAVKLISDLVAAAVNAGKADRSLGPVVKTV